MATLYRVGEVAEMTGVSIRTLHHYDRLGLLRPTAHSVGGHRLYGKEDLLRLQQILTLRLLGFKLKRIGELLDRPDFDIVGSLEAQRHELQNQVGELQRTEAALGDLLATWTATGDWDWSLVHSLSHTVQDQIREKGKRMERFYSNEEMARFAELRAKLPAEEIQAIEHGWTALLADVRASRDADPASPEAQELVSRWDQLQERTRSAYEGYGDLWQSVGENYDAGNFEGESGSPDEADFAFIERARQAAQQP